VGVGTALKLPGQPARCWPGDRSGRHLSFVEICSAVAHGRVASALDEDAPVDPVETSDGEAAWNVTQPAALYAESALDYGNSTERRVRLARWSPGPGVSDNCLVRTASSGSSEDVPGMEMSQSAVSKERPGNLGRSSPRSYLVLRSPSLAAF
jgi:hypothetical protein